MSTRSRILALLLEYGPMSWEELCLDLGLDDPGPGTQAWENLEHLMELGVVRLAMTSYHTYTMKYKAVGWSRQRPLMRCAA